MCRPTITRIRSRGSERALPEVPRYLEAKGGFEDGWIEKEGEGVGGAKNEDVRVK